MNKMKNFLALVVVLSITLTLIPTQTIAQNKASLNNEAGNTLFHNTLQTFQNPVAYQPSSLLDAVAEEDILINSPSGITYDTWVSCEVVTEGKTGETHEDTRPSVIRFILNNPGEQQVTFHYTAVSGSTEYRHLTGILSGIVSLSKDIPQQDVTIDIAPFADNPEEFNLPNTLNAFWTGEQFFYLFCGNIQNALFDEGRETLTLPVPVESEFDYVVAYENAIKTGLIDLNRVAGGLNGVFPVPEPVPEGSELRLTAEISGDVRKVLDAGVFTHIHLPQGYFINESDEAMDVTYHIKAMNDKFSPPREASISKFKSISLAATSPTSFYSDEFPQEIPVGEVNLGPLWESNGIFNKLDFIFDYSMITTSNAISTCFLDETGQYLQHHVGFSDKVPPEVKFVSIGTEHALYGYDIPVIIEFSEPVYTKDITFEVDGQTLSPMEGAGTISQSVSFLYRIGDEALNTESFTINVTDITGAVDLSGKAQDVSGSGSASVRIPFDLKHTFAYCAEPSVILDQGTSRNMSATISIPLKYDTELSNWLINESRISEGNISKVVTAKAISTEGNINIPLTVQTNDVRVTGLTGSFTVPENNTGEDVFYALEIYLDTGSGDELIYSLARVYAVQPLILVEGENDITIDYTYWPIGDNIFINEGSSLSLGYFLNVDATWIGSEYFNWSSSDESVAKIDNDGVILLMGTGQVYFTLTVTNPLSEAVVQFRSHTLSALESQDVYLYVPNGIKNQDLLIGSNATINFSSNLVDRNDLYGGAGTETTYTFTLYELDDDSTKKDSPLSTEGSQCHGTSTTEFFYRIFLTTY